MANTYTAIATVTVGSGGAGTIDFNSIPQTYTDLIVKFSTRSNRSGAATSPLRLYPNGSSTNITLRYLQGAGSAVSSGTEAVFNAFIGETVASTATASTFGNFEIYIPNYTSSNYKSISVDAVEENNQTIALSQITAFLWSNTAAITSLQIVDGLGSFVQYSSATLYGIKNS